MTGARLKGVDTRIAFACAATNGLYVTTLFIDESGRDKPGAAPDAIYVSRFNPYDETLLYDVRRGRFLTISWPDWLEERERPDAEFSSTTHEGQGDD